MIVIGYCRACDEEKASIDSWLGKLNAELKDAIIHSTGSKIYSIQRTRKWRIRKAGEGEEEAESEVEGNERGEN